MSTIITHAADVDSNVMDMYDVQLLILEDIMDYAALVYGPEVALDIAFGDMKETVRCCTEYWAKVLS